MWPGRPGSGLQAGVRGPWPGLLPGNLPMEPGSASVAEVTSLITVSLAASHAGLSLAMSLEEEER